MRLLMGTGVTDPGYKTFPATKLFRLQGFMRRLGEGLGAAQEQPLSFALFFRPNRLWQMVKKTVKLLVRRFSG